MSTLERLQRIFVDQLGIDESDVTPAAVLGTDHNVEAADRIDVDSLDIVELVMAIEEEFDVEIPDAEADKFKTVGDIIKFLEPPFAEE